MVLKKYLHSLVPITPVLQHSIIPFDWQISIVNIRRMELINCKIPWLFDYGLLGRTVRILKKSRPVSRP